MPAGQPFIIKGTARATSGVRRVQVEVEDRDTSQYLQDNLTTWGSDRNIDQRDPGQRRTRPSTNWSLPLHHGGQPRVCRSMAKTFGRQRQQRHRPRRSRRSRRSASTTRRRRRRSTARAASSCRQPSRSPAPRPTTGVNSLGYTGSATQNRYLQDDGTASAIYNTFRLTPGRRRRHVGDLVATTSTVPYEGNWGCRPPPIDTAGQSDLRSVDREWLVDANGVAPTSTINAAGVDDPADGGPHARRWRPAAR